ncbi:MAG: cellulase family glycosylhydrolase [Ktedonobacteraceae bacterium]|nr:cellulase family glycosylhydrolase [Ktedonobacteraceae bacterium]
MFKKAKKKNKRTFFLLCLTSFLALTCSTVYAVYPYATSNLLFTVFPFLSPTTNHGSTFYGENIDMSQILPTSQHYVINRKGEDLIDIAAELGINLIRITNAQRSFPGAADSIYTKSQWHRVLSKMQSKGIKALILIETASSNGDYYTPDIRPVYLELVQKYIDSGVFSHPDVYAVDIQNEPLLTDANMRMLQSAHRMIKEKYPSLLQTIGWWATTSRPDDLSNPNTYNWSDFSAGKKIADLVDFYSIHMYGLATASVGLQLNPALKTKEFLLQVENALQTNKPMLIEEFGEANGDNVSDQETIGSPELQANVYQGVYQALKDLHRSQFLGSVAFDFYSRNQYADAWAIVKNKGNYLFPAAYILQAYASGKNPAHLQASTIVHSQSYLLRNADNYALKDLHVADRIGLKLQLDASQTYTLALSEQGILQPVALLHYDPVANSYYAVYQAIGKGKVQLTITSANKTPFYTITVAIS